MTSEAHTIERLRRAAAAAHAIPGLGLRLHQADRPTLRVARCGGSPTELATALSPCRLRAITIALTAGCQGSARQIVDPDRHVTLEWFATHDVAIGPFDVFQVTLAPDVGAFVFAATGIAATQAALGALLTGAGSSGAPEHNTIGTTAEVPIELRLDVGLDVALVWTYYHPADPDTSSAAAVASCDLLACAGVTQVEAFASITADGR